MNTTIEKSITPTTITTTVARTFCGKLKLKTYKPGYRLVSHHLPTKGNEQGKVGRLKHTVGYMPSDYKGRTLLCVSVAVPLLVESTINTFPSDRKTSFPKPNSPDLQI